MTSINTLSALSSSANPVTWMRAVLMDLGFGGLIEEIEKRFGKPATNILLGILMVGIAAWVLDILLGIGIKTDAMIASGDAVKVITGYAIDFIILGLMVAAAYGFIRLRADAAIGRAQKIIEDAQEQMNAEREQMNAEVDEMMK